MFDHSSSDEKMRHKYDNSDDCDDSEDDFILVWLRKLPEKCFDLPELHGEDNRYYWCWNGDWYRQVSVEIYRMISKLYEEMIEEHLDHIFIVKSKDIILS